MHRMIAQINIEFILNIKFDADCGKPSVAIPIPIRMYAREHYCDYRWYLHKALPCTKHRVIRNHHSRHHRRCFSISQFRSRAVHHASCAVLGSSFQSFIARSSLSFGAILELWRMKKKKNEMHRMNECDLSQLEMIYFIAFSSLSRSVRLEFVWRNERVCNLLVSIEIQ